MIRLGEIGPIAYGAPLAQLVGVWYNRYALEGRASMGLRAEDTIVFHICGKLRGRSGLLVACFVPVPRRVHSKNTFSPFLSTAVRWSWGGS